MLSLGIDSKLTAVYEHLGLTGEDVSRAYDQMELKLDDRSKTENDTDFWLATGGKVGSQ